MMENIIIKNNDKDYEFTPEEFNILKQLIKAGLEFELTSYSLFEDISFYNDMKNITKAMDEIVKDKEEQKLMIILNKDKELVEKIKNFYEGR